MSLEVSVDIINLWQKISNFGNQLQEDNRTTPREVKISNTYITFKDSKARVIHYASVR
jgi:hypothetical protein